MCFKEEKIKFNENRKQKVNKTSKYDENVEENNLVEVVPKEKNREEFINGINNKIKILDFMKTASLEDVPSMDDISSVEVATDKTRRNPFDIQVFDDDNKDKKEEVKNIEKHSNKKGKLDNDDKEVMTKEIEENISLDLKNEEKIYNYPTVDLLNINSKMKLKSEDKKELIENANKLEGILNDFGVDAKVIQVTKGPSVTRFEIQPSPGVKVSKIVNLQDDIALGLAASGVRMEAPIPGKAAIGIEVPNRKQTPVFLREVLDSKEFKNSSNKLAFALGKDIAGKCVVGDLSRMPHMLIAGATELWKIGMYKCTYYKFAL